MAVEERVKEIIVEQLGVEANSVTDQAKFVDDLGFANLFGGVRSFGRRRLAHGDRSLDRSIGLGRTLGTGRCIIACRFHTVMMAI